MAKEPTTFKWIEELLPKDHRRKAMFGGFGYYVGEYIVLVTFESFGNTEYKNQKFNFELWNGCLFPAEKERHAEILKKFSMLINHPILPKWLYLPSQTEGFDDYIEEIIREIRKRSPLFGTIPKQKKSKGIKKIKEKKAKKEFKVKEDFRNVNMKRPQMFGDAPAEGVLANAKSISDLKNLGPATEVTFAKAGIKTAKQFIKLGWKKTMIKLVKANPKNRHPLFAYALIGALTNRAWNAITDEQKLEAREFTKSLKAKK